MPTRSINLKMFLGKKGKEDAKQLEQALWTTHWETNKAVAKIEKVLLLCRGNSYLTQDQSGKEIIKSKAEVQKEALELARQVQKSNSYEGNDTDTDVLDALRKLYERIIQSCLVDEKGKRKEGNAQDSNAWVSPLMDKQSKPFEKDRNEIIDPPPAWLKKMEEQENGWKEESEKWRSEKGSDKLKHKKSKQWQKNFAKDQNKRKCNVQVYDRLRALGLLPLFQPTIKQRLKNGKGRVSRWDRCAMRLAAAHLLSWEAWNDNTKKAHDKAKIELEGLRELYQESEEHFAKLREYEISRHEKLKQIAYADDKNPFRIGIRATRAWNRLRKAWLETGNSRKKRIEIIKDLQTELGQGKFGDPDLFIWLADDDREHLWRETDSVTQLVKLNTAEKLFAKRKPNALMTFADAYIHPRWVMFEAPGGSNLRCYSLKKEKSPQTTNPKVDLKRKRKEHSHLCVTLPLLCEDNGSLTEKSFQITLAPSDQLSKYEISNPTQNKKSSLADRGKELSETKSKTTIKYSSANQEFEGELGGAEILFDRSHLELESHKKDTDKAANIKLGPVWFKLTLNVTSQAEEGWIDGTGKVKKPPEVLHCITSLSEKSEHQNELKPGLRVLSIDLGLRTFASCAVFELVKGRPKKGLHFPIEDGREVTDPEKLWAQHKRSFKLSLPGENVSASAKKARAEAWNKITSLKRDIESLKGILRLGVKEGSERDDAIALLKDSIRDERATTAFPANLIQELDDPKFRSTDELWKARCNEIYDKVEKNVAKRVSDWRNETRPRPHASEGGHSWRQDWHKRRGYNGGKSIWMIEYLEAVRNLIKSWNLRGRVYGQVNREDKKAYGTIASNLLEHINNCKNDRIQTGADMIIQAARGFVYCHDKGLWEKKYTPCRVILFENLARYRFSKDRSRRENSQLMKWNHREISKEAEMQAELYGITVESTAAGFSSRYLASNGAPGFRCRYLTGNDFGEDKQLKKHVAAKLKDITNNKQHALKVGSLIVWEGGEFFITLNKQKNVHLVHADLNAAQNLQRRFWGRCGEAFRIRCKKVSEDNKRERYELQNEPGKRLWGALQKLIDETNAVPARGRGNKKGRFYLTPVPNGKDFYTIDIDTKFNEKASEEDESCTENEVDEATAELDKDTDNGSETFFRDPSGIFFDSKEWIPSKIYWATVKAKIWEAICESRPADEEDKLL